MAVAGGNKVKLKDGEALFKAVRIEAEAPGVYTLHAKSASRKVGCQQNVPETRMACEGLLTYAEHHMRQQRCSVT